MRKQTFQLFIVLIFTTAILGILTFTQLFATADGPFWIYLPSIFKQADGSTSGQTGGDDTSTGDDVPAYSGADFEIEGNLELNGTWPPAIDWESTGDVPDAEVEHVEDPHSKRETDPTIFKPDGKFDKPESWIIQDGKVGPGQNELTNIMAWLMAAKSDDDDDWLVMGMERTKKEGTFFLDFEYNQSVWDPTKGGPERRVNDVVVGFELKGNPTDREKDLSVLIVQYLDKQPSKCEVTWGVGNAPAAVTLGTDPCPAYGNSGFYYRFLADGAILADSGLGRATMNDTWLPVPAGWNSYDSQGKPRREIPPFEFAEAAINLDKLDIELDCGFYSSMHAKDRSSLEPNSDLKDLAGPIPLKFNCLINGHKFLDLDADGVWAGDPPEDGLEGWDIHIENTDPDIDWSDDTKTDADGFYEFDGLVSGTYEVSESCPANENWLQTSPGLTDFDGCGDETYTVVIDRDNREETGKDFGNIDPNLEVQKQCTPHVFVGDEIGYEITITNTGNPTLTGISVDDTVLGPLGEDITLAAGASETLTKTVIAETAGTITNTVTASTEFALVTISDEDTCVTVVHELDISKDANGSFKREYVWTIDKVVDKPGPIPLLPQQTVSVTYTITPTATPRGFDYQVTGTISITNPAPMSAELASVTDMLSNGIVADVTCPSDEPHTVPAKGQLTCTYKTPVFQEPAETNTATANRITNVGGTIPIMETVPINFGPPSEVIDQQADVVDDYATPDDTTDDKDFGRIEAEDTPLPLNYDRLFGPLNDPDDCDTLATTVNTASVTPVDSGNPITDTATVELYLLCTTFLGFEDKPEGTVIDYDYNDFVIDIDFEPTFLDNGKLSHFTFEMIQEAGPVEFTKAWHEFRIKPVFAPDTMPAGFQGCNGDYEVRVDGVLVESRAFVDGGTLISVTSDRENLLVKPEDVVYPLVTVAITFNTAAPYDGCPFEVGDINIEENYHCNDCFFDPSLDSSHPRDIWDDHTIPIGDVRMLSVFAQWQWLPERPCSVCRHINTCYPDVIDTGAEPEFAPFWWLNWNGPTADCPRTNN